MSLPNDVCRCVNDTCPLRERCLRWQAFLDDRERKEEGAYVGYARFRPRLVDHGNHVFTHECDNIITGR
jgi:hypothetical protein